MSLLRRDRALTAVAIMLDVGFHAGRGRIVSGADIAERLGQPRRGIEPALQALARADLLHSTRGARGGYRLGRPAREISLATITAAVMPEASPSQPNKTHHDATLDHTVIQPLWQEMELLCQQRLSELTLDSLIKRAVAAGLERPSTEPITFSI